jgi:hypothetical protein
MRIVRTIIIGLSITALAASSGSDDRSEQPHHFQAGPYVGGGSSVGFLCV